MSLCSALLLNREIVLKTYKRNGGTKSLDIAKVLPSVPNRHRPLLPPCPSALICLSVSSLFGLTTGVKLCLVALKCDLRDDERTKERLARHGEKCITYDEGLAMAKHIKAVRYLGIIRHSCTRVRILFF